MVDFYKPPSEATEAAPTFELTVDFDEGSRARLMADIRRRFLRGLAIGVGAIVLVVVWQATNGLHMTAFWLLPWLVVMGLAMVARWVRWRRSVGNLLPRTRRTRWRFLPDRVVVRARGSAVEVPRRHIEALEERAGGILMGGGEALLFIPGSANDEARRQAIRAWVRPGRPLDARGTHRLIASAFWSARFVHVATLWIIVALIAVAIWKAQAPGP